MQSSLRRVYDPLYGEMQLSELEQELLFTPEIQRLRYVRLCNINSLLISGASEISRFEHILGVLRLAKEWLSVRQDITEDQKVEFVAAAILHDFQTGPFGHSLQYVLEDNEFEEGDFRHDDLTHGTQNRFHQLTQAAASFCGRPFRSADILGRHWEEVVKKIRGDGEFGALISGTMDLDNIDNVIRLAYHVGAANSSDAKVAIDLSRNISCAGSKLLVGQKSVESVERWYEIRKRLYELLLLDWAEFSAKAMLTKAIELAAEGGILGADSWLKTDLEFYNFLEKESIGDSQQVGELVKRIRCGELYFPVVLSRTSKVEMYNKFTELISKREIELELKNKLKGILKFNFDLIVHPILDVKKTQRSVSFLVKETKEKHTVGVDSSQLLLGVFISKNIEKGEKLNAAKNLVSEYLVSQGLRDIEDIADPVSSPKEVQLELL